MIPSGHYLRNSNNRAVCYAVGLSSLSVRLRHFSFFSAWEGGKGLCFCCVFCPPFPEKGILDFIPHGLIIGIFYGIPARQEGAQVENTPPLFSHATCIEVALILNLHTHFSP